MDGLQDPKLEASKMSIVAAGPQFDTFEKCVNFLGVRCFLLQAFIRESH